MFNTCNITNFKGMFMFNVSLTEIPLNGTNFEWMFQNCYSLVTMPQLDLSNAVYTSSMFDGTPFE